MTADLLGVAALLATGMLALGLEPGQGCLGPRQRLVAGMQYAIQIQQQAFDHGRLLDGQGGRRSAAPSLVIRPDAEKCNPLADLGRITSYNVCYTKLLRGRDADAGVLHLDAHSYNFV